MNVIDLTVIVIIALSVLMGLYRGFIQAVLNLSGGLASFVGSFWLFPRLADMLSSNTAITRFLSTYTDSGSLLGNLDLSSLAVNVLSPEMADSIVARADLPEAIATILSHNLKQRVFSPLGSLATTVGDYVNQTVLSVSINVLCFLLCFLLCLLAWTIVVNLLRAVFRFPVLKHLDALAGAVFGFLLGVLLCFALFTLLPLIESVVPLPQLRELVAQSALADVFENGGLIVAIMNRRL